MASLTKNPTTATQTASDWSFLSRILACDNSMAAGVLYPPTDTITTGSFGLSASGAITGYKIEVSCYATNNSGGAGNTAYLRPSLQLGGANYFTAVTPTLTAFPTGTALNDPAQLQTVSWGVNNGLWFNESTGAPATFSLSDLLGAQVTLLFDEDPGGNGDPTTAYIDCVRLTVYYEPPSGKTGGDDAPDDIHRPRVEIWTTRKAKTVRARVKRKLAALKKEAPELVEEIKVPAVQPDWRAYTAQLEAVSAQLDALAAQRLSAWIDHDDEDILLLL